MLLKSNSHVCVCEMVPETDKSQEQVAGLDSMGTILLRPHWEWGNVTFGSNNSNGIQFTFDLGTS